MKGQEKLDKYLDLAQSNAKQGIRQLGYAKRQMQAYAKQNYIESSRRNEIESSLSEARLLAIKSRAAISSLRTVVLDVYKDAESDDFYAHLHKEFIRTLQGNISRTTESVEKLITSLLKTEGLTRNIYVSALKSDNHSEKTSAMEQYNKIENRLSATRQHFEQSEIALYDASSHIVKSYQRGMSSKK